MESHIINKMPNNPYCERLGISAPNLDAIVGTAKKLKLFYLMVVALVERGGPMTAAEIAGRLRRAGVPEIMLPGGLERTLVKSWHGSEPVYRLPDGRFGLDLDSHELDFIIGILELKSTRHPGPPTPVEPPPADDVPLSEEEVLTAFRDQNMYGLSALWQSAALLDALGKPMTFAEIEDYLSPLTSHRSHLADHRVRRWTGDLVRLSPAGSLELNRSARELAEVRRDIRKRASTAREHQALEMRLARIEKEEAQEHARQVQEASEWRRALLHVVPGRSVPGAVSVLDVENHSIRTFVDEGLCLVADALSEYNLLAGLRIRDALHLLGLDAAHWRVVDLASAPKSIRLNRQGRTLRITPEMLIRSTTGISKPLGDPRQLKQYLVKGEGTKLRRRLESDVKALHSFYRYGILHDYVRLRWGFLDNLVPVNWRLQGEPDVIDILREAAEAETPVDIVTGSAPGWAEPWARARRGQVIGLSDEAVQLSWRKEVWPVYRFDIQAIRIVRL